jgi:hypothetical protein
MNLEDKVIIIRELVRTAAEIVATLYLSNHPGDLCFFINHPFKGVNDTIETFTQTHLLGIEKHYERAAALQALISDPYSKLRSLGIINDDLLVGFLKWAETNDALLMVPQISWAASHIMRPKPTEYSLSEGKSSLAKLKKGKQVLKKDLTNVSELVNVGSVKAQGPNLLERLKKATQERGKKSALAKFLGVPLVRVSQWLSGDREPGGETTLKMLHWVEQQERQI